MKRIKDKKLLVELMLKTNLVINAMCITFDIKSMRFAYTNRIVFDNNSSANFDLVMLIAVDTNDSGKKLSIKDKKHIKSVCKVVEEVRQYISMHLYKLNVPKLKNFTDADIRFVENKIDYLNDVFNEYKKKQYYRNIHSYILDI